MDERHVVRQLGVLMDEVRARLHLDGSTTLRASHHRVIGHVPPEGISVTDLAERVGMTKQGCGQFVTQLVDSGHLETRPDPHDRRVRLVLRTAAGRREVRDLADRLGDLENEWAAAVGPDRYTRFREVLDELADAHHACLGR